MLEVEKWAKDKNLFIALIAPQLATSVKDLSEGLQHCKDRRLYGHQFPLPDLPLWFKLYRSNAKPYLIFLEFISMLSRFGENIVVTGFMLRKVAKLLRSNPQKLLELKPSQEELNEGIEFLQTLLRQSFEDIAEDINDAPLDPSAIAKGRQYFADHQLELGFVFLVFSPCWFFYQMSPAELYRKALQCDVTALERLMRLDPLMLHDPAVGKQIQSLRFANKTGDYERVIEAARKGAKYTFKDIKKARRSLKAEHAALITALSEHLPQTLSQAETRSLYDAVAKDCHGHEIDTDINSPEGFAKTVKLHLPKWQKLFPLPETNK